MAEYEEDELADNSDNEKRLFRVEARVGRKKQKSLKDVNKKKGVNRKSFFRAPWQNFMTYSSEPAQATSGAFLGMGLQCLLGSKLSEMDVQYKYTTLNPFLYFPSKPHHTESERENGSS